MKYILKNYGRKDNTNNRILMYIIFNQSKVIIYTFKFYIYIQKWRIEYLKKYLYEIGFIW